MNHTETLTFKDGRVAQSLFLNNPKNLEDIEKRFDVKIVSRDGWIKIDGSEEDVEKTKKVFSQLLTAHEKGIALHKQEFNYALESVEKSSSISLTDLMASPINVSNKRPRITPKSANQKSYLNAIKKYDLVFGTGPAGTGKTYLAVASALEALKEEKVKRIILTRPAVETGEALGFLPGDFREKIAPYLRPLYDSIQDMIGSEEMRQATERGVIEIAPLAYMRGRTLARSFVILDEAQNTTTEQMFMFLTRIGSTSQCCITGDQTQIDLPERKKSGLIEAMKILKGVDGIAFQEFSEKDVLRHRLVQDIVRAYRKYREVPSPRS